MAQTGPYHGEHVLKVECEPTLAVVEQGKSEPVDIRSGQFLTKKPGISSVCAHSLYRSHP